MMRKVCRVVLTVALIVVAWQALTWLLGVPSYLLPSPLSIGEAFVSNREAILNNSLITIGEVAAGFIIANVISIMAAIAISFKPSLENGAMTVAIILKTLPVIALAPVLVLWFGSGVGSKVAAVVVVCFFPSLVNILRGIKSLDSSSKDLISLYSPTRAKTVRYFILPGVRPYLFSALKVSSSLAVIGALVGEFVSANSGLGFMIISGYYSMDISLVFAILVVTSILGLLMYEAINILEKDKLEV